MNKNKSCGNCKHYEWHYADEEFYCRNEHSECCGCPMFYDECCEDWEEE